MKKLLVNLISFYQKYLSFDNGVLALLAPGGACKSDIACSEYTKQSIQEFGVFRGSWMGLKRVWSCR